MRPGLWAASAVLVAAACSGAPESATADLSPELRRDLELAESAQLELASSRAARAQFASAIEVGREGTSQAGDREAMPTPRRSNPPAPAPSRRPTPAPQAEAPVADDLATSEAPTDGYPADAVADEAAWPEEAESPASDEPVELAGPNAGTDGVGTTRPRDPGGWGDGDLGGIGGGGVVIRGGPLGDDDHCQYHPRYPRGGGGVPVSIGRRYPAGYPTPVYGGAIPRSPTRVVGGGTEGRSRVGGGSTIRSRGSAPVSAPRSMPSGGTTRRRM